VLDELWDAGLLENRGIGRYTLHQTIADYVRLQGTDEAAQQRLAHYMHGYVQVHGRDYAAIELETTNILVAFDIATTYDIQQVLVEGVNALIPFLRVRGLYTQADHYLQQALRVAQTHDDQKGQMLLLSHLASIAELRGEYGQAESYGQQGLLLARQMQHQQTSA
jgi:ATP/maltotriose-dependent transcriptional regulator MalT